MALNPYTDLMHEKLSLLGYGPEFFSWFRDEMAERAGGESNDFHHALALVLAGTLGDVYGRNSGESLVGRWLADWEAEIGFDESTDSPVEDRGRRWRGRRLSW